MSSGGSGERAGRFPGGLLLDEARTRLWPLPVAALVAAVVLGVVLPEVDASVDDALPASVSGYLFGGGADAARSVLSTICTSLMTVTSLTFSLTVVTLQLASSQYSPRLLRTFTRDRFVHRTLAVFLGSFVYALTVLRTVRASDDARAEFVPQIAVTVAFVACVASVLMLVLFLAHLAQEIRVETILRNVHDDATATFEHVLGPPAPGPVTSPPADRAPLAPPRGVDVLTLVTPSSGFVVETSPARLVEAAAAHDALVVVDRMVGEPVVEGTPVARVWSATGAALGPDAAAALQDALAQTLRIRFERTARQDVAFGLRQLTDVATRALSPGINDPTTAVHALSHASALLCDLLRRDGGPLLLDDEDGTTRVSVPRPDFVELLDLAVAQPRTYGGADRFVLEALVELLGAVAWLATRADDLTAIDDQLARTLAVVAASDLDAADRARLRQQAEVVAARVAQVAPGP